MVQEGDANKGLSFTCDSSLHRLDVEVFDRMLP